MVAEHFSTPVAIRLKAPPPLNVPLTLEPDGDRIRIRDDRQDIGIALQAGEPPEPSPFLSLDQARLISEQGRVDASINHPFPSCFVCGPNRDRADGMRVFTTAQMPTRRSMLLTGSRRQRGQVMARQSMRAIFGQRWTARVQGQPLPRS